MHEPRPHDREQVPAFPAEVLARHLANTAHELAIGTVPGRPTSCVRQLSDFAETVRGIAEAQGDLAVALAQLADHLRDRQDAPGLAEAPKGEVHALVLVLAAAAEAATSTGAALAEAGPLVAETVACAGEDTRL
jgi:hypothetical protein